MEVDTIRKNPFANAKDSTRSTRKGIDAQLNEMIQPRSNDEGRAHTHTFCRLPPLSPSMRATYHTILRFLSPPARTAPSHTPIPTPIPPPVIQPANLRPRIHIHRERRLTPHRAAHGPAFPAGEEAARHGGFLGGAGILDHARLARRGVVEAFVRHVQVYLRDALPTAAGLKPRHGQARQRQLAVL